MIDLISIQEEARKTLINFGNKVLYSGALGKKDYPSLVKDQERLNYLYGVIANSYISGMNLFIGEKQIDSSLILKAIEMIRHYQCRTTDLSQIGVNPSPTPPIPVTDNAMRVGHKSVVVGSDSVTFSSPLPSADYTVVAWVIGVGESQYDLGTLTLSANGFTASGIIMNGTLYYQAIMNQ